MNRTKDKNINEQQACIVGMQQALNGANGSLRDSLHFENLQAKDSSRGAIKKYVPHPALRVYEGNGGKLVAASAGGSSNMNSR